MINLVPNNVLASWWPLVLAVIPVWWHDFQILTKKVPLQGGLYFLRLWVFLSHTTCAPEHVWTLSHEFPQHRTPQLKRISFGRELVSNEHLSNHFRLCANIPRMMNLIDAICVHELLRATRVRLFFYERPVYVCVISITRTWEFIFGYLFWILFARVLQTYFIHVWFHSHRQDLANFKRICWSSHISKENMNVDAGNNRWLMEVWSAQRRAD